MLSNVAQAATVGTLLKPGEKADTAAASTTTYVSITDYEGYLMVTQHVGLVTAGSIAGKLVHADDDSGTNVADITGATFTSVTTSNDDPNVQKVVINSNGLKPYIGYVGTITTGPVVVGVTFAGVKKYV